MTTAYQFACGSQDIREKERGSTTVRTVLWREGGVYHVRTHESGQYGRGRRAWESFTRLKDARKEMARQWREFAS